MVFPILVEDGNYLLELRQYLSTDALRKKDDAILQFATLECGRKRPDESHNTHVLPQIRCSEVGVGAQDVFDVLTAALVLALQFADTEFVELFQ